MKTTKKEVVAQFRELWADVVANDPSWRGDSIAKRTAFNDYTDGLCKDGIITTYQYENWSNPF